MATRVAVARRRPRRIRGRLLCRRPRHGRHPHRRGEEPRRRVPLPGLHPVEGAAARRQGHRRGASRHRLGRHLRRAEDRRGQAARLQEPRGREAHQRDWPGGEAPQGPLRPGPRLHRRSNDAACAEVGGWRADRERRLRHPRHRLAPDAHPVAVARLAARDGFHRRARPARHPEDDAGDRRRLHRPGAGSVYARARHEGVGGGDDARPAAGRRPRPGAHPRTSAPRRCSRRSTSRRRSPG